MRDNNSVYPGCTGCAYKRTKIVGVLDMIQHDEKRLFLAVTSILQEFSY
jgi:hypothetical protein